jgi:hypothetical protein
MMAKNFIDREFEVKLAKASSAYTNQKSQANSAIVPPQNLTVGADS